TCAVACGSDDSSGGTGGSAGTTNGGSSGSSNGGSAGSSKGGSAGSGNGGSAGTGNGGSSASGGSAGNAGSSGSGGSAGTGGLASCAPLPMPSGNTVRVTPGEADQLPSIVAGAASGTTILLADGTYTMSTSGEAARRIQLKTPGVTLRGESGDASKVILDGEYQTDEMVTVHASDVTLAHFTVAHAVNHPIHVTPDESGEIVSGTRIYGMRIIDGGEQFVKINQNGDRDAFSDDGSVECSYFELTDAGRPHIERNPGGCYTGGIDGHSAQGWVVRQNTFKGIYCAGEGLAEHAVHFWSASRDTLVENNTIIDCARGVGFGLVETGNVRNYPDDPYPGVGYIGHYDGIIRNNVIWANIAYFDTGIELDQAHGAKVFHNTIAIGSGATGFFSGIDYRFANSLVEIANNIAQRITVRNGAMGTLSDNLEGSPLSLFVDASGGDFHLAAGGAADAAVDQGGALTEAGVDIDGETHDKGSAPDIGADER
ncbi:MAG: hypothetical protein AB7K71_41395, partial [Polyangiaceae bacterium]